MTENKQYSFNVNKNTIEFDGKFKAYVNIVDGQRIVDLLNALHEENVKLQARNKYLATKIQRERNIHVKEHEKWEEEIQKENQQFKKALMELKKIGDYQEGRIKELNDENEQLKQAVEEFIENKTQHNLWKLGIILKELKGDLE